MLAIRPPTLDLPLAAPGCDTPAKDDTLVAALAASTSELEPEGSSPIVRVEIDPELQFDWATMTIVYRIAQDAVLTAARCAGASRIGVAIRQDQGQVLVEVHDDGIGVDEDGPGGASLATMRRLAELGGGTLTVTSTPHEGTVVRCALGNRVPAARPQRRTADLPAPTVATGGEEAADPSEVGRRHLHVVTTPDDPT
jgi:signal transduction histidine kinase